MINLHLYEVNFLMSIMVKQVYLEYYYIKNGKVSQEKEVCDSSSDFSMMSSHLGPTPVSISNAIVTIFP